MRNRLAVPAALPVLCLLGLLLSGCFGGGAAPADLGQSDSAQAAEESAAPSAIPTATPTPAPPIAVVPALAMDGPPPTATLSTETVSQGGAILVRATGGTSGAVTVFGRSVPMQLVGDELVALFGFGT